jgi:hypothetical protein
MMYPRKRVNFSSSMFHHIAERHLVYVSANGHEMPMYVAVGQPYFPAQAEEMKSKAGCLVLTCDDPDLATELHGDDEMEALVAALEYLELFLINVVQVGGGSLRTVAGAPFDASGSPLLRASRALLSKKRASG